MNIKVFNLKSRTNETRHIEWYETCKCKCRLNSSVCNDKQRWNNDKCRCEYKELIDKSRCDKRIIWNSSTSECDKSWDVGKYLDYENYKCRKKLIDKLVEERGKNIDWNKMIHNATLNDNGKVCNSCTIYIALLVIAFSLISSVFFCANTGTVIYYYKKMLYHNKITFSEGIDIIKSNKPKECIICHYWYFLDLNYTYEPYVSNGCHVWLKN